LAESIFLASIIPKPKKFASQFDQNQKLKDYVIKFYEFILQKMLKKNFITQNEFDQFKFEIEILGQARSYLNNVDTLINEDNDSILFENYPLTY
jgi:hypothetical protein